MHGEELKFMKEAYDTNWMTTAGSNINALEEQIKDYTKSENVVALSSGTSALHLAMKLAGIKKGDFVFCSDVTFSATINPVTYEGGIPIFIDSEYETWNMDPKALEKAFELYPNVKVVVLVHLYGVPAKIDEIKSICDKHGAILIEDAAESLGATYKHQQTGTFGHYSVISFNGNKIITGSSGGALLTPELDAANKVRKWSTQAREQASWYQHEEIGYNYRMSNVIAGVARGQMPYLDEHIKQKKAIYDRYRDGLKDLPIQMNPFDKNNSVPNYWLSCMTILPEAMAKQVRSDSDVLYTSERGKSTPSEILDALNSINAESRPIWKPMHSQPIFRMNPFITKNGDGRAQTNAYINSNFSIVGTDIFERGLCLPSDNKMTVEEQDTIINTIRACFE
jgi:dTDP-4-amino-4,6-dideoxygalactose transaminase